MLPKNRHPCSFSYICSIIPFIVMGCAGFQVAAVSAFTNTVIWAVERHAAEGLEINVRVGGGDLSRETGKGSLKHLSIGNPAGFQTETALEIETVRMELDPETLDERTIVVEELTIESLKITYEIRTGKSNLQILRERARRYLEKYGGLVKIGENVIIRNLYVRGGVVEFSHTWMDGEVLSMPLPDLHLTDLGTETEGLSPAVLMDRLTDVFSAAAERIAGEVSAGAEQAVENLKEKAEETGSEWVAMVTGQ